MFSEESNNVSENYSKFNDSQDEKVPYVQEAPAEPPLRRSNRIKKKPGEWWKESGLVSRAPYKNEVPESFYAATPSEIIDFCKPGNKREDECITKNKTWKLVPRTHDTQVLPRKYVFNVKDGNPEVRLVAFGCRQIHGIDND